MGELNRRPDVADPPSRPGPPRPVDPDVQAELARLTGRKPRTEDVRGQRADLDAKRNTGKATIDQPGAELEAAKAEIADLKTRLEQRDAKLDAANAEISELKDHLHAAETGVDEKVGTLEARFEALLARQERRIADLESRLADPDAHAQRPDHPADDGPEQGRVSAPVLDEQARSERADEPPARRRGPSDAALGFMVSGAGTALSEVATLMPPAAHAATLTTGVLGMGVSGIAWVRQRKARNADRSEG